MAGDDDKTKMYKIQNKNTEKNIKESGNEDTKKMKKVKTTKKEKKSKKQKKHPISMASPAGIPPWANSALIVLPMASVEPMEISRPPQMKTSVIPRAGISVYPADRSTLIIFPDEIKAELMHVTMITYTTTMTRTPLSCILQNLESISSLFFFTCLSLPPFSFLLLC